MGKDNNRTLEDYSVAIKGFCQNAKLLSVNAKKFMPPRLGTSSFSDNPQGCPLVTPYYGWKVETKHFCKHFGFLLKIDTHKPNVSEVTAQVKAINATRIS